VTFSNSHVSIEISKMKNIKLILILQLIALHVYGQKLSIVDLPVSSDKMVLLRDRVDENFQASLANKINSNANWKKMVENQFFAFHLGKK
jgi:hypothetical protein